MSDVIPQAETPITPAIAIYQLFSAISNYNSSEIQFILMDDNLDYTFPFFMREVMKPEYIKGITDTKDITRRLQTESIASKARFQLKRQGYSAICSFATKDKPREVFQFYCSSVFNNISYIDASGKSTLPSGGHNLLNENFGKIKHLLKDEMTFDNFRNKVIVLAESVVCCVKPKKGVRREKGVTVTAISPTSEPVNKKQKLESNNSPTIDVDMTDARLMLLMILPPLPPLPPPLQPLQPLQHLQPQIQLLLRRKKKL